MKNFNNECSAKNLDYFRIGHADILFNERKRDC